MVSYLLSYIHLEITFIYNVKCIFHYIIPSIYYFVSTEHFSVIVTEYSDSETVDICSKIVIFRYYRNVAHMNSHVVTICTKTEQDLNS